MQEFTYYAPTAIYFGADCLRAHRQILRQCGARGFILTSRFANGCQNLALEDAKVLLKQEGISFGVFEEVEENPTVESIQCIANQIREYVPDFLLAIGGGSALDTAKAANVLLTYPAQAEPYEVFYGDGPSGDLKSAGRLPMFGIPTTVGSGSEVMGYAVLTRTDTHTKLRMDQMSYFDAAFLDARYVVGSPQWLLDSGAMDALSHGVEGYLHVKSARPGRLWHDYGFEMFAGYRDALLSGVLTMGNFEQMLVAASVQGIGTMQSGTTIPHAMGYPLTHFKGVSHGIASVMTIPAYLELLRDTEEAQHIIMACGFSDLEEFAGYIRQIVVRNVSITVTAEELETWTDEVFALKNRLSRHRGHITRENIRQIYLQSLAPFLLAEQKACSARA